MAGAVAELAGYVDSVGHYVATRCFSKIVDVDDGALPASIATRLRTARLERMALVYPGARRYVLTDRVEAVPLATLAEPGHLFEA